MRRIFVDSSVLFSAAYSKTGHAHDLILLSAQGQVQLVLSNFVIEETRHNLSTLKVPRLVELEQILSLATTEMIEVGKAEILEAAKHIVLKDAPIMAAARQGKVDMLVSYDRKHILGRPSLEEFAQAKIVSPAEAIQLLRNAD